MNTRIALPALVSVLLTVAACGQSADKAGNATSPRTLDVTLTTGTQVPPPVLLWMEAARRGSGGRIRVTPGPPYRPGDAQVEAHMLAALRSGEVQLGWLGVRAFDQVGVHTFEPLVAPFLIDSYPMLQRVFADGVVARMSADAKVPGVVVIGVLPGPFRRVFGITRPIQRLADFRGAVVGTGDSALAAHTLELLGATPRPMAAELPLDGLDGDEQQLSSIVGNGYDQPGVSVTANLDLWPRPVAIVASKGWYDKLDDAQRAALRAAVGAAAGASIDASVREDREAQAAICASQATFVTSTPADLAGLRAAVEPIYRELAADSATAAGFARIQHLKGNDPPDSPGACPAPAAPAAAATRGEASPIDAEYAVTVEADQLPPAEQIPEAYGTTRIVIDGGTFRITHHSNGADWTADGTARVTATTVTLTFDHVEDVGPHGTPNGVPVNFGATLEFGWASQGDGSLQLTAGEGQSVAALDTAPLHRTGAAPGQKPSQDVAQLQGAWTSNPTGDDVIAHHDDAGGIDNNTGPLRLEIDGTHFVWTQDAPDGEFSGEGTIAVVGDTVEFHTASNDGSDPLLPFYLRWSVRHDQLTFRAAPGFSPESWTYHPWTRPA